LRLTIEQRLANQRAFRLRKYAEKVVRDKSGLMMLDYKLRARLFGNEWKLEVWRLCKIIKGEIDGNL